jgi:hypothetical protein
MELLSKTMRVRALRALHLLSVVILLLTFGWLLMVFVAAGASPQPVVTVRDRDGKVLVDGKGRVVFRSDHSVVM